MYQTLLQNASIIFIFYNFFRIIHLPRPFSTLPSSPLTRHPAASAAHAYSHRLALPRRPAASAALSVVPQGAPSPCISVLRSPAASGDTLFPSGCAVALHL